jgi:hypothetical protein
MASPETSDAGAVYKFFAKDGRMTPEGLLKKAVVTYLSSTGLFWRRTQSGMVKVKGGFLHLMPNGTADFLVCPIWRKAVWIELKAPGQVTAKERKLQQADFAAEVRNLGHYYFICMSVEEVQAAVSAI